MGGRSASFASLVVAAVAACGQQPPPVKAPIAKAEVVPPKKVKLAVLLAESDAFPKAAKAASESLTAAQVGGIDETQVSKVTLEVVQLSIECVDPSDACYQAVGHSLDANRLLFAQIAGTGKKQLKVTITLFDVDANAAKSTAAKVFATEAEAATGIAALVAEATR